MVTFHKQIGTMLITQFQGGKATDFEIEIMNGNCLAVFTYNDGTLRHLYNFWMDESHVKRIHKQRNQIAKQRGTVDDGTTIGLFDDHIKSIRLNIFYKEADKLAKILTKYGYEVTIYYQKEK